MESIIRSTDDATDEYKYFCHEASILEMALLSADRIACYETLPRAEVKQAL